LASASSSHILEKHPGQASQAVWRLIPLSAVCIARVTELSATSETSFDDAFNEAVAHATKTLRGVEGAWVKDQNVLIENGNIIGYKVNLEVTFMLEE
jgi:flavin-binding protein dodecin